MAATKLNAQAPFINTEELAMGSSAESIASAGGTVPANSGEIWFFCPSGDNLRWLPGDATPTTSFGHRVIGNKWGMLTHAQQAAKIISEDGSDVTVKIVYMRGSARADRAYSISLPN